MRHKTRLSPLLFGAGAWLAFRAISRHRRYDLRGKNVLITGGSRGLGLAMAHEFASRGANVAICARDADELQRAAQQLVQRGFRATPLICDVTRREAATTMVQQLESQNGQIDVLVNNAGRIEVGPLETATVEDFENAMATHFWAPLHLMLAVIPGMKQRGEGRIVNISSIGGKIGVPHLVAYAASKFALSGLSEAITAELRKDNIFVSTIYPGLMRTGSPRNASFKGQHRKEYSWFTLSDSLPVVTIAASRAARKIVDACQTGRASLVITPGAKLAALAHGIAPNTVMNTLALINRLLPGPGGIGTESRKGHESETMVTRSPLTVLDESAARNLNQVAGD